MFSATKMEITGKDLLNATITLTLLFALCWYHDKELKVHWRDGYQTGLKKRKNQNENDQ